jgi:hypothetical protein
MTPPDELIAASDVQGAPMINRGRGVCQPAENKGESGGASSREPQVAFPLERLSAVMLFY